MRRRECVNRELNTAKDVPRPNSKRPYIWSFNGFRTKFRAKFSNCKKVQLKSSTIKESLKLLQPFPIDDPDLAETKFAYSAT